MTYQTQQAKSKTSTARSSFWAFIWNHNRKEPAPSRETHFNRFIAQKARTEALKDESVNNDNSVTSGVCETSNEEHIAVYPMQTIVERTEESHSERKLSATEKLVQFFSKPLILRVRKVQLPNLLSLAQLLNPTKRGSIRSQRPSFKENESSWITNDSMQLNFTVRLGRNTRKQDIRYFYYESNLDANNLFLLKYF